MMDQTNPEVMDFPQPHESPHESPHDSPHDSPPPSSPGVARDPRDEELTRLRARLSELQRERDHLVTIVDILQEVSSSLHFVDILQTIARKLGETFGLDRCAIFLTGEHNEIRLVASYEDPSISNLVVDLNRYPELKRAFESGETVFIPDAINDPALQSIKATLDMRNVRSIVVVPIQWQGAMIGAIFLRTDRDAEPFSQGDVAFTQVVASLTAKALRNAHRFESLLREHTSGASGQQRTDLQRIALVGFLHRLFEKYATSDGHIWAETLLPKGANDEFDRLVSVAMQVINEEAAG
jgi:transcriptional regulator with GAF, ATPase, and Fis domain